MGGRPRLRRPEPRDYAINRYYSPDTGRFTTHDPLTELDRPERLNQPQGLNLYPYVMGAPTRYTDPDGLDWWYLKQGDLTYFAWVEDGKEAANAVQLGYSRVPQNKVFDPLRNAPPGREDWGNSKMIAKDPKNRDFFTAFDPLNKGVPVPPPSAETGTRAVPDIKVEQRKNQVQEDFDEGFRASDVRIAWAVLDFQGEAGREAILGFGIGRGVSLIFKLRRARQAAKAARLGQEAADAERAVAAGTSAEYAAAKEAGVTTAFSEGGSAAGTAAKTAEASRAAETASAATRVATYSFKIPDKGRHIARYVRANPFKTKPLNTVADNSVDMAADIAAINAGQAIKSGSAFVVNGRTYAVNGAKIYPISGSGLHTLNAQAYRALGFLNTHGNNAKTAMIMDKAGIPAADRLAALQVWSLLK